MTRPELLLQATGKIARGFPAGLGDLSRCPRRHDTAAFVAGAGTEVDDPVAVRDDIHVVLDHDHAVAGVHDALELGDQPLDIPGMKTGGRLVQDIEGVTALRPHQLGRELDALGFPARQFGGGLAEADIAEADLADDR